MRAMPLFGATLRCDETSAFREGVARSAGGEVSSAAAAAHGHRDVVVGEEGLVWAQAAPSTQTINTEQGRIMGCSYRNGPA